MHLAIRSHYAVIQTFLLFYLSFTSWLCFGLGDLGWWSSQILLCPQGFLNLLLLLYFHLESGSAELL